MNTHQIINQIIDKIDRDIICNCRIASALSDSVRYTISRIPSYNHNHNPGEMYDVAYLDDKFKITVDPNMKWDDGRILSTTSKELLFDADETFKLDIV